MKYIDISRTIFPEMEKYPSDPKVEINIFKSFKKGNSCNLRNINFGTHTGTHVDAPHHIFDRAEAVDSIDIEDLICEVIVLPLKNFSEDIFSKKITKNRKGLIFKSSYCHRGLTLDDANLIISHKIKIVGIDQMTIEENKDKLHPVHRVLLGNRVIIIEGLNLKKVKFGCYKLICFPLKIKGGDGAPARAVLLYD